MRDPWKYVAFPAAAVTGYLLSQTAVSAAVGNFTGLGAYVNEIIVVALSGLLAGFLVDELIPAYIEKQRGSSGGDFGGDMGGGSEGDLDFGE